jgi:hypothetical protein
MKPFQLTDDMQQELTDGIKALAGTNADDPAGPSPFAPSLHRRAVNPLHSEGTTPGPFNNQTVPSEEAVGASPSIEEPITIEQILDQRSGTHGDFTGNARISQMLKDSLRNQHGWGNLSDVQREALDMISHKIARALTGNPDFKDHWDDIAGYAKLVSQRVGT